MQFGEGLTIGILAGFMTGACVVGPIGDSRLNEHINATKKKAIEVGAAYYHPTTGEFTWREKVVAVEPENAKK